MVEHAISSSFNMEPLIPKVGSARAHVARSLRLEKHARTVSSRLRRLADYSTHKCCHTLRSAFYSQPYYQPEIIIVVLHTCGPSGTALVLVRKPSSPFTPAACSPSPSPWVEEVLLLL